MRAAIVREFGRPPELGEFEDPAGGPSELVVRVEAGAVSPLVLTRAAGTHYSAERRLPFVPGVDGVGWDPAGRRVYFQFPRPPYGSLAELAPVPASRVLEIPETLDATAVAAGAISGMSCWSPLTRRAVPGPGEGVLVNGATGAAGSMAVQVARYLGAPRVIATGRSEKELQRLAPLGATDLVRTDGDPAELRSTVRRLAAEAKVGVVLDYLWGPTTESILAALGGLDGARGPARVRLVQIGTTGGPVLSMEGALLRSCGLEVLGHGIGAVPPDELFGSIGEFLRAMASAHFVVDRETHPLAEVGSVWGRTGGARRLVLTVP